MSPTSYQTAPPRGGKIILSVVWGLRRRDRRRGAEGRKRPAGQRRGGAAGIHPGDPSPPTRSFNAARAPTPGPQPAPAVAAARGPPSRSAVAPLALAAGALGTGLRHGDRDRPDCRGVAVRHGE